MAKRILRTSFSGSICLLALSVTASATSAEEECRIQDPKHHAEEQQALLQVGAHRTLVRESFDPDESTDSLDAVDICTVQDSRCFDMSLPRQWSDKTSILLSQANAKRTSGQQGADATILQQAHEGGADESLSDVYRGAGRQVQIVVTRSGEDVRWLDALSDVPTIVYNRGGLNESLPAPRSNLKVVHQANVGREDQAMMQHIVDNYDSLPEATVFLQGWPFVHCPGVIGTVRKSIAVILDPDKNSVNQGAGIAEGLVPISESFWEYEVNTTKLGLARSMAERAFNPKDHAKATKFAHDLYLDTCKKVLGDKPCPNHQWTAEGAQWAVSRKRIRSTPKHVYLGALAMGEGYQSKFRGLVLEALWPVLWGQSEWSPGGATYMDGVGDAYKRARASRQYCAPGRGVQDTLLFSCRERMAFCEIQHREHGVESRKFLNMRQGFKVSDGSKERDWSMVVQLVPITWGSAIWTAVSEGRRKSKLGTDKYAHKLVPPNFYPAMVEDSEGRIKLQPVDAHAERRLNWTVQDDSLAHGKKVYHFFVTSDNPDDSDDSDAPRKRYLGCNPATNAAELVETPVAWTLTTVFGGWQRLDSDQGRLSLLRENQGYFSCVKRVQSWDSSNSTFQLNMQ
eukprot:TRINITY_DN950_c4_g1_i1.p1 TRINITY_DN950_c4_g1~~TRINITY_DN950_c4_g1_i1.p1  ORF type:complete len:625 (+),score=86.54 TRINITY_DN950_c4_g1_i1:150-2024(+)